MCEHRRQQGDNYGVTCMDCGETLAGYGYWAEGSKVCKHDWITEAEDSDYEVCMYCERVRLKEGVYLLKRIKLFCLKRPL